MESAQPVKAGDVLRRGLHLYDVLRVKPVKYLPGRCLVTLKMRGGKHRLDVADWALDGFEPADLARRRH